jgi:hypothetical protein
VPSTITSARLRFDPAVDHLSYGACDRDGCRQHHIAGAQIQYEEDNGRQKIEQELGQCILHSRISPGVLVVIATGSQLKHLLSSRICNH